MTAAMGREMAAASSVMSEKRLMLSRPAPLVALPSISCG